MRLPCCNCWCYGLKLCHVDGIWIFRSRSQINDLACHAGIADRYGTICIGCRIPYRRNHSVFGSLCRTRIGVNLICRKGSICIRCYRARGNIESNSIGHRIRSQSHTSGDTGIGTDTQCGSVWTSRTRRRAHGNSAHATGLSIAGNGNCLCIGCQCRIANSYSITCSCPYIASNAYRGLSRHFRLRANGYRTLLIRLRCPCIQHLNILTNRHRIHCGRTCIRTHCQCILLACWRIDTHGNGVGAWSSCSLCCAIICCGTDRNRTGSTGNCPRPYRCRTQARSSGRAAQCRGIAAWRGRVVTYCSCKSIACSRTVGGINRSANRGCKISGSLCKRTLSNRILSRSNRIHPCCNSRCLSCLTTRPNSNGITCCC